MTAEQTRLEEALKQKLPWKKWGPYLGEQQRSVRPFWIVHSAVAATGSLRGPARCRRGGR